MNNLFFYASKELSTDAFLAWLFCSLSFERSLAGEARDFFIRLGLCVSTCKSVADISVRRQEKYIDLIVHCNIDGRSSVFLFENKRHSTMHSGQLDDYKEMFPDCDRYFYLKLGFISYAERKKAEESGYEVIDSEKLLKALKPMAGCHFLVAHYTEYLEKHFVVRLRAIRERLTASDFDSFQAQQYFLSLLHQSLVDHLPNLEFRSSANRGGSPWTELNIATRHSAYGDKTEALFWRIDKRGKGYYLRLTQYSYIGDEYRLEKKTNLVILRNVLSDIPLLKFFVLGKVRNYGVKASEVLVFFFVDNDISAMVKELPALTVEIEKRYRGIESWVGSGSNMTVQLIR